MDFTPRSQQILQLLLESGRPVGKQEIADRIGVSKRTVQREFGYLEGDVAVYGLTLETSKGRGVELTGPEEGFARLRKDLAANGRETDPGSREERRKRLLFELLRDRTPRKLYYYSQMLGVSEATIGADMDALCPWLERNHLSILRRQGYGVVLEGEEKEYREAMRLFIAENIHYGERIALEGEKTAEAEHRSAGDEKTEGTAAVLTNSSISPVVSAISDTLLQSAGTGVYSLLNSDTLQRVDRVLRELREPRIQLLADNAYAGLVIHISISIERLHQGAAMEEPENLMQNLEGMEEYPLCERILAAMEREFGIEIPRGELLYIMLHLRGAKMAYSVNGIKEQERQLGNRELLDLVDRMTEAFNPDLAQEMRSDDEFIRGLLVHLQPVLVRLRNHLSIYNPIMEEIRSEYPEEFAQAKRAAAVLEKQTGFSVSDEEIGFLMMHFGAAQDRARKRRVVTRKVVIGVVCASGFGVARLMLAKLRESLGSQAILHSYGKSEINQTVVTSTDFFVSTMNLEQFPVDYVQVSPLIPPADLDKIEYKIKDYSHIPRSFSEGDISRQLDEANFLMQQIKGIIQRYRRFETGANVTFKELLRFLAMQVTESLHAAVIVVDAVTEREEMNSQIFPELGIALLHCRTAAVQEPVFVSCTPRGGGSFAQPYMKEIRAAVLMLMPVDDRRDLHAELLGSISSAFVINPRFTELIKSGSEAAIRSELARELKCFFFDYMDRM